MPREEVIARLEAVEARGETRFVQLGGKLDYLTDILIGDHGLFAQMKSLRSEMISLKAESRADNRATRWTIVITLITSIMAASALILSVQANLLAAFQAGQAAAPIVRGR